LNNITDGFVAKYLVYITHMCTTKNYQIIIIAIGDFYCF
jgi:hypothetical protein